MVKQEGNNIKLGLFVMTGLAVLIFAFYMIGKSSNIFGTDFELKARFRNLNGLAEGNNVLFSGLQAGTVKKIDLINDTVIEVTLQIDKKIQPHIHQNALVAIGTEGLMGNKVINITPSPGISVVVMDGDLLPSQKMINTDEMLLTLSKTNNNIASISQALKVAVLGIDSSVLFKLINDKSIGESLRSTLKNINVSSENTSEMTAGLNDLVSHIKQGKGTAGLLLSDTAFAGNARQAMIKIRLAADNANKITILVNRMVTGIQKDINEGKGPVGVLLRDSSSAKSIRNSLDNIQKGTDGFNQNMEALKHNFLFKGYFKNLEKNKQKALKDTKAEAGQ